MNRAIFPLAVALVLIASFTLVEGMMRDRWGEPGVEATELGKRFDLVPKEIGDWEGEDLMVDEVTRKTAGAVNYVSRLYTNKLSGRKVRLWLIIGHARDICRHTPNVCYPNQGFRQQGVVLPHEIPIDEADETPKFYTAKFLKEDPHGRHQERVFWAWNTNDTRHWNAPDSPRFHYGMGNALYKLYFVTEVGREENTVDSSVAVKFAELMLPALNKALFSDVPEAGSGDEEAVVEETAASES